MSKKWTAIIEPPKRTANLRLNEVWQYRDLILLFVKRDFTTRYKQTILGPLWFLIQPLFITITQTFVFGNIAKLSTDGLPQVLFYMAGNVFWLYFSTCLTSTSNTFTANAKLFGKIYIIGISAVSKETDPVTIDRFHPLKFFLDNGAYSECVTLISYKLFKFCQQ